MRSEEDRRVPHTRRSARIVDVWPPGNKVNKMLRSPSPGAQNFDPPSPDKPCISPFPRHRTPWNSRGVASHARPEGPRVAWQTRAKPRRAWGISRL